MTVLDSHYSGIGQTLDNDRASLIINARSANLEVIYATDGWRAYCGEPGRRLTDLFDEPSAAQFRQELQDLVNNAANGSWNSSSCKFTLQGVHLEMSDGTELVTRMHITVPHPKHMGSEMYPARVSIPSSVLRHTDKQQPRKIFFTRSPSGLSTISESDDDDHKGEGGSEGSVLTAEHEFDDAAAVSGRTCFSMDHSASAPLGTFGSRQSCKATVTKAAALLMSL